MEHELDALFSTGVKDELGSGGRRATRFLDAGRALLLDLIDDPGSMAPSPQLRLLFGAYVSPGLVVATAASERSGPIYAEDSPPDYASFLDLWPAGDYLVDVLIWSLRHRLAGGADGYNAEAVIAAGTDERSLARALEGLALRHVERLMSDPVFRLQAMISATTLTRDQRLGQALRYITSANVAAWVPFWKAIADSLGPLHWPDAGSDRLAALWHAGTESVASGAIHGYRADSGKLTLSQPMSWLLKLTVIGIIGELSPYRTDG